MDHKEVIEIYLADIRIALNKLEINTLEEHEISQVVNDAYAKMRLHFDKHFISVLSEDEIEDFFETIDSKTNELIDSTTQSKKA